MWRVAYLTIRKTRKYNGTRRNAKKKIGFCWIFDVPHIQYNIQTNVAMSLMKENIIYYVVVMLSMMVSLVNSQATPTCIVTLPTTLNILKTTAAADLATLGQALATPFTLSGYVCNALWLRYVVIVCIVHNVRTCLLIYNGICRRRRNHYLHNVSIRLLMPFRDQLINMLLICYVFDSLLPILPSAK